MGKDGGVFVGDYLLHGLSLVSLFGPTVTDCSVTPARDWLSQRAWACSAGFPKKKAGWQGYCPLFQYPFLSGRGHWETLTEIQATLSTRSCFHPDFVLFCIWWNTLRTLFVCFTTSESLDRNYILLVYSSKQRCGRMSASQQDTIWTRQKSRVWKGFWGQKETECN